MHKIDEASPLYGLDMAALKAIGAEILLTVTGLDDTSAQPVYARRSYLAGDIRFGHAYADIFSMTPDGRRLIDYGLIDMTEEVAQPGIESETGQ
jgi:inward rectifier potassium channel